MRRLCIALLFVCLPLEAQVIRRPPCDFSCQMGWTLPAPFERMTPLDPSAYYVPRSVGAITVVPDMTIAPLRWWSLSTGRPFGDTVESMAADGVTAVGVMMRAHPTDNRQNNEDIGRAFQNPDVDVIVLTPLRWASTGPNCKNDLENIVWLNYPPELFDMLFEAYGDQPKTIIVQTWESDHVVHGIGCRERYQCVDDPRFRFYRDACEAGTLVPYGISDGQTDCAVIACDMQKVDRAAYLVRVFDARQAAVEAARAAHPDAVLRVFHSIELNKFGDTFLTVAADVIPKMVHPPDLIGLSLWAGAGDVGDALDYVLEATGLPVYRIYVSEVGAREGTQPDGTVLVLPHQYDRIVPVVEELFDRGIAFAMVWSWDEVAFTGGHTGYAVIDPVTGEHLSGFDAIVELNQTYR